jgi:hypothetical protein
MRTSSLSHFILGILLAAPNVVPAAAQQLQPSTSAGSTRAVGAISAIHGNVITLKNDDGSDITVNTQEGTRFARIAPGEKDLKNATPLQLRDLQTGDRLLVRGASSDNKTVTAATVLVMKKGEIEAKQQTERQEWQRRGVGGLVTGIDADTGIIRISTTGFAGKKTIAVHTTKETVIRRYAPDSIKFDDAKISALDQIRPGDQLRARGKRSADGAELAADEIVSGSFRNIAGTIATTDAGANTITLTDLITKKPVIVKITGDSQIRKLPPEIAQRIAMRLKGGNGSPGQQPGATPANGMKSNGASESEGARANGMGPGGRAGGPPDFQQLLNRLPPASVGDFKKGDVVMLVSTEGSGTGLVTAITLLGGAEPILAASPSGEPMRLSPWTLGSGGGEEAAQ